MRAVQHALVLSAQALLVVVLLVGLGEGVRGMLPEATADQSPSKSAIVGVERPVPLGATSLRERLGSLHRH